MTEEPKVLLVDDEWLVLRSMEKTLVRAGYDVQTARNSEEGLVSFKTAIGDGRAFQVAILDLNMPNLEGKDDPGAGLELLSRLLDIAPDLSIVVLSAFDEVGRAREAVAHGARAYFVKGREAGLVDLVNSVLEAASE
jgi:ActR/RegA family two-component response regulator